MTENAMPTPAEIRAYRAENAKMRERDIAANLGISEAALVAAEVGISVTRIEADPNKLLARAPEFGTVMALSRNESAVHEKIGVYEAITIGEKTSLTLGENIDLRIFNWVWAHAFAVTKTDGDNVRRSLQYFDKSGEAIHKIHLRPESNLEAYESFVSDHTLEDQSQEFAAQPFTRLAAGRAPRPCRPCCPRPRPCQSPPRSCCRRRPFRKPQGSSGRTPTARAAPPARGRK